MKVFLCEKPSQARDIASVLGAARKDNGFIAFNGGVVTWAFGHLLEAAEPDDYEQWKGQRWSMDNLPILPEPFHYVVKSKCNDQLRTIGKLLKEASEIVIATDADREGEMIAREILEYHRYKGSIKRLWLSALDPESVRKALNSLKDGNSTEPLFHAARARSQADWLVGMNLTRAVTLHCRKPDMKGVFSIGRVQTPTLALIVRRDLQIENFKPRDYFELLADIDACGTQVKLRYGPTDEEKRLWIKEEAQIIANRSKNILNPLTVSQEDKKQAPPKLFSLSLFQQEANKKWGWSADKALKVVQSLYETHKATTYPRTDCEFLPEEQKGDATIILSHLASSFESLGKQTISELCNQARTNPVIRKTVFNTAKITAHHAIIPTKIAAPFQNMDEDEKCAYVLIATRYLAILLPDYEYSQTTIQMEAGGVIFSATGSVPVKMGWKVIFDKETDEEEKENTLPDIKNGTVGTVKEVRVETKQTKPPARYTEGTLIADMKSVAKYVTDIAKKSRLKETSGIGTEATRATVISTIKDRGYVETKKKAIISTEKGRFLIELLEKYLPQLADAGETAVWEDALEVIAGGKGTVEEFIKATGQNICSHLLTLRANTPEPPANSNGNGVTLTETDVLCPKSEKPVLDCGTYWRFPGYPGVYFNKEICKRQMSLEEYVDLLNDTEGREFGGFVWKSGKKGKAKLHYNPRSKKIEFVFK